MSIDAAMPVLVVDSYRTMTRIVRDLLGQLGFLIVDEANSAGQALDRLKTREYALVISDTNLEPVTGHDLLKTMRDNPNLAKTRFIMMSADANSEILSSAKNAGADNYIFKPFDARMLKGKIEATLAA